MGAPEGGVPWGTPGGRPCGRLVGVTGPKTRGESADSPLTTMPETPTPALFLAERVIKSRTSPFGLRGSRCINDLRGRLLRGASKSGTARQPNRQYLSKDTAAGRSRRAAGEASRGAGRPDRIRATPNGPKRMNRLRAAVPILVLAVVHGGCGGRSHRPAHGSATEAPEPAPPTPDTTPIEALRTPAGLVLKIESQTPSGPLRGPSDMGGEVTPVPSPSKP